MTKFLILKLEGVLQAWGGHTFEDYRPSHLFPTRSALLGLLGACLGIERSDSTSLERLAESVDLTVRADRKWAPQSRDGRKEVHVIKITDFHTVMDARKVDGKSNPYPVVSRREYLCDASFTVIVGLTPQAVYTFEALIGAIKRPTYTPFLGRRSCLLSRPLFEALLDADNAIEALKQIAPHGGTVYAENALLRSEREIRLRDVPITGRTRRFATRSVYIYSPSEGGEHVPQ